MGLAAKLNDLKAHSKLQADQFAKIRGNPFGLVNLLFGIFFLALGCALGVQSGAVFWTAFFAGLPALIIGTVIVCWIVCRPRNKEENQIVKLKRKLHDTKTAWETDTQQRLDELKSANQELRREIRSRRESEARIRHLMDHDSLTDLPNRRHFLRHLNQWIEQAPVSERRGDCSKFAVMMVDLDRFKEVNDTLGHPAGDKLLKQTSSNLKKASGPHAIVARMGGDEFAVLLPGLRSATDASLAAEKILESLCKTVELSASTSVQSNASIGVAFYPEHGDNIEKLLTHADLALYEAKSFGRGRYSFFSNELQASMQTRHRLEKELKVAVEQNQFELVYQPRYSLISRKLVASEALIRWNHPEHGMIEPSVFMPIAETTGIMGEIGRWILLNACQRAKKWQLSGAPTRVTVNLSPSQFRQHNIARQVLHCLDQVELEPELLELEITEVLCTRTTAGELEREIRRLKGLGVKLVIDDFGTGYSCLNHLKWIPVDAIKIDRSFISNLQQDKRDRAIVKTIITLAKSLGKTVIAEGVETDEQLDCLLDLGCDEAQGFLLSRPIPGHQMDGLLAA